MQENQQKLRPVTFVIFGATGDLARTKLFPALFNLLTKGKLPEKYSIIGFSRRDWSDSDFQTYVSEILVKNRTALDSKIFDNFINSLRYIKGDFTVFDDYKRVVETISKIDVEREICSDRLLYLAAPPEIYEFILSGIDKSGLAIPCGGDKGWARVLIEKPFGTNTKMAERLEKLLSKWFKEEQIFRIDHYLAKETIQNILTFRFSNTIFEPVWNRKFIESVHIFLLEEKGIGTRGSFYDGLGALRDVGQNHLLQMLALVTMENPVEFNAKSVRKSRADIFKKISIRNKASYVRGQYEGYSNENGVSPESLTETYFFAEAVVNNKRWKNVPFYIETGKNLKKNEVKIVINFKPEVFCLKPPFCNIYNNQMTFHIQPKEEISIRFWKNKPGFGIDLEPKYFNFSYKDSSENGNAPEAYEKVLFDAISGDQMLFATTEEISASWKFIHKVAKKLKEQDLIKYKEGSEFEMGKIKP